MRKKMSPGERFGRLVTVSFSRRSASGKSYWTCVCDCGATKEVMVSCLRSGGTQSCGCLQKEVLARPRKHGFAHRGKTAPEYSIYKGMIKRCTNPNRSDYENYGGRGIKVCERWAQDFTAFMQDMGPRPGTGYSIDRIDHDGDYEPGNCRWSTEREQQNNRRDNRMIMFRGQMMTLSQVSATSGIKGPTIAKRLDRGWSIEDATTLPPSPISPQRSASRPLTKRVGYFPENAS